MPWNIDMFLKRSSHYKNNYKPQSLRDILRQIVWKNTHFDKLECQGIVSLMENGFSFTDTLQILKTKRNERRITQVLEKLEQGQTFKEAFSLLLPHCYRRYFNNFIRYLPVLESMRISVELATHEEKMKQKMNSLRLLSKKILSRSLKKNKLRNPLTISQITLLKLMRLSLY